MQLYGRQAVRITATRNRRDLDDPDVRLALERAMEIIGEAARNVSGEFREAHPEIPWRRIIAMRNVLAHGYAVIDLDTLWQVATDGIPELLNQLEALLGPSQEPGSAGNEP